MTTRSRTHLSQSVGNRIPFGKQNSRVRRFVRLQNGRSDALGRIVERSALGSSVRSALGQTTDRKQALSVGTDDRYGRYRSEQTKTLGNRFLSR
ncbi:unnamed protein product [Microthlaspi erraticum]|uniref:Uncharacterized protein n=1 Tax=Microthlaspi erraticum TaxID=1685480 RepID=A0A6D2KR18_9BRAS|nr:unnamed protein product [Microthlaspi erraticum]